MVVNAESIGQVLDMFTLQGNTSLGSGGGAAGGCGLSVSVLSIPPGDGSASKRYYYSRLYKRIKRVCDRIDRLDNNNRQDFELVGSKGGV